MPVSASRTWVLSSLLLAGVLASSGCSSVGSDPPAEFEPGELLETSQPRYSVEPHTTDDGYKRVAVSIPYALNNTTSGPLTLTGCVWPEPPALEKRVSGAWETVYYLPQTTLCLGLYEIPPNDARKDTLRVRGYLPGQEGAGGPVFEAEVEGTYRLRVPIYSGGWDQRDAPGEEELLPLSKRVSNTFELR